jgi:phosphinothricin acetyltransferase
VTLVVRPATTADADACAAIYAPYVLDTTITFEVVPPTPGQMAARIADSLERHAWLVAEQDDEVVGYAYGAPYGERAAYRWSTTTAIYLRQGLHRTGLGRRLYGDLLDELAARGQRRAFGAVTVPNPPSAHLHVAMGFALVGVMPRIGFKHGRWIDVAWYARSIGDGADDAPPDAPHPPHD